MTRKERGYYDWGASETWIACETYIPRIEFPTLANIGVTHEGKILPKRGHDGTCKWFFDGQFWYHVGD